MALLYNLARMTTPTTGTGTLTLGSAVSGFITFVAAGVTDGQTITYAIQDGSSSEIGRGVYTASGTTLTRSVLKSTNSDAAISLSGSAQVFITPSSQDFNALPNTLGAFSVALAAGTNVTANRTLTLTTGNADRTLDISAGSVTVSAFGASLVDDADASASRTTLELGAANSPAFTNLALTGYYDITEIATPANPAANVARLYAFDDAATTKLAFRDSAGVETVIGAGGGGSPSTPQGRLTLTAATPVLATNVTGATTVYYTPYLGQYVPLYDGASWTMTDIGGELSQATTDNTKSPAACAADSNYDIFVWSDGGTYRATRGPAWTSSTGRGTGAGTTELERAKGVWVNKINITNGPAAQRGTYVGTIRTNSSSQVDWSLGGTAAGGTEAKLHVWNAYNRVKVSARVADSTSNWAYASTTWRASNNSNANRISLVAGFNEEPVVSLFTQTGSSTSGNIKNGINLDSTSATPGAFQGFVNTGVPNGHLGANYTGYPGVGAHYLQAMESGNTTVAYYGNGSHLLTLDWAA